jgi:predicted ATPase
MLSEVEIEETSRLSRDGSNLAGLLAYLKLTDYKLFHIIEERLRDYVPEVEELVIKPGTIPIALKKVVRLQLREKGFESSFTEISDGTLRLLGFVTAMSMNHSLVAFEEPENCVHPHLLETLVDMMRKADCQVIVTTHSPYLLSHVRPEEVIVVWREMGEEGLETKVKRPSEEELARVRGLLEEGWTLGEVWYSGIIGGTPE